jgi:tetratricopeptide (TPR) repeat protein
VLAPVGPRERRFAGAWAIAILAGAAAFALAGRAYRELDRPRPLEELSYYPSGNHLRAATLGHGETVADLAWLRAVQYYGEHRRTDNHFERLPHLFDILTSLSPRFVPAYVFAAFALAQEGGNFPEAERLMLKGLEANPRSGRLAFELGFLYYVRPGGRDLEHAAYYFEQAARQPDAPPQSARFAAFARQNAGDLRMAYELWSVVYERSPNRYLRDIAERNLREIRDAIEKGRRELAMRRLSTPRVLVGGRP